MASLPRIGLSQLLKEGTNSFQGLDEAVYKNTQAASQLANMLRTSIGPNGLFKLVVNHLEKLFVTKDAATVVSEIEVEHPAAKILAHAAMNQAAEFGDATNLVLIIAGALMTEAEELLKQGLNVTDIINGYEKAADMADSEIEKLVVKKLADADFHDPAALANAVEHIIGTKHYDYRQILARLVGEACVGVMPKRQQALDIDNVRIAKVPGASVDDSLVLRGMVIQRRAETDVYKIEDGGNVAIFGQEIGIEDTETKATVRFTNADELTDFAKGEEERLGAQIEDLKKKGVKVVVSGNRISDLAAHFLQRAGMFAFRITSKFELRRFAKTIGAKVNVKFGPPVDEQTLGWVDSIRVQELGGQKCIVAINDTRGSKISTIVLRSATKNMLDDLARACDNGINAIKALAENPALVPGAGATELAVAKVIEAVGKKTETLEQYSICCFAEALEAIPRTLAETAGFDTNAVIPRLTAAHAEGNHNMGVNVFGNSIAASTMDAVEANVLDVMNTKQWAIRMASIAAVTILRVDQIVWSKRAGGPAPRGPGPRDSQ